MKLRIEDLTLREKIGQTAIFRFDTLREIDDFKKYFKENPVGASWSMVNRPDIYERLAELLGKDYSETYVDDKYKDYLNMVNELQRVPIVSVIDAESGIGGGNFPGHEKLPSPISLGASKSKELAFEYGKALGKDLRLAGVRWYWGPVADNAGVYKGPRALTADNEVNCELLAEMIRGVQSEGVAACAKHFPGSDPLEYRDSHFCANVYSQSYEYWEENQGKEFKACIDAGVASIMVGHKSFRAVDDTMVNGALLPATLSHKILTGLIKEKLGFKGVVITDDVYMKAMSGVYGLKRGYIESIKAGADMILGPVEPEYIDIIEEAVKNGEISEERINDACQRVLDMKERFGLFDLETYTYPTEQEREEAREGIREVSRKITENSITLVANHNNLLPINPKKIKKVKLVYIGYSELCFDNLKYAAEEFEKHGAVCDIQRDFCKKDNETLKDYDLIIYSTYIGHHQPKGGMHFYGKECDVMRSIMIEELDKSMGVSFGCTNIYFEYFSTAKTFVNAYSPNKAAIVNFVKALYGETPFGNYHPFPLNPINRTNDINM